MAVPKRKTSKMKKRQRKASHKKSYPNVPKSSDADEYYPPHQVNPETGMYRGKQVLTVSMDD